MNELANSTELVDRAWAQAIEAQQTVVFTDDDGTWAVDPLGGCIQVQEHELADFEHIELQRNDALSLRYPSWFFV